MAARTTSAAKGAASKAPARKASSGTKAPAVKASAAKAAKGPAKKAVAGKASPEKKAVKKAVKTAVKKASASSVLAGKGGAPRADYGAPADAYFARQSADQRVLLEALRGLVLRAVPDVESVIKWGVPFYERKGVKVCALAAFKDYVAINFFAPPELFVDPGKKLEGAGKSNRTLKVRSADDIDRAAILLWVKAAAFAAGR